MRNALLAVVVIGIGTLTAVLGPVGSEDPPSAVVAVESRAVVLARVRLAGPGRVDWTSGGLAHMASSLVSLEVERVLDGSIPARELTVELPRAGSEAPPLPGGTRVVFVIRGAGTEPWSVEAGWTVGSAGLASIVGEAPVPDLAGLSFDEAVVALIHG